MERRSGSDSGLHRDQLDTIPADSDVLGRLKSLSRADADVDELLADPVIEMLDAVPTAPRAPRSPQASVPFDLTQPAAVALTDVRPPQLTIPFELSRESPIALRPREPERERVPGSVPPPTKSRLGWWLGFMVVFALLIAGLAATGVAQRMIQSMLQHG